MSFLQSLSKGSTSSNTSTQKDDAKIWADRLTSEVSSSSSAPPNDFRTQGPQTKLAGEAEYESFLSQDGDRGIKEAVGPYSLLDAEFSPDIEFQKSIDGLDVVGLLEVMDTQQIEIESFVAGKGGEKSMGNDEEVDDPVEWLGVTNSYTDDVWGDQDTLTARGKKGKQKEGESNKMKSRGKGKGVDMKSRL
ncbi:hypothetical protein H072_9082 [Dactylellina haptotyla CBS 200.50]|uniref:Uncharacterized protein n=1 Tax=Dactylellina haptotyla (strain CBS 200.50) TaxID=1284197 RepID=S8A3H3_DACHA|nr:hypothetical protein H072_9082 [Dactylellina haptotyla CBS 200.50]